MVTENILPDNSNNSEGNAQDFSTVFIESNKLMPPPISHNCIDLLGRLWDQFMADTSTLNST